MIQESATIPHKISTWGGVFDILVSSKCVINDVTVSGESAATVSGLPSVQGMSHPMVVSIGARVLLTLGRWLAP